ncbi:MAG: hypothetical protein LT070_01070 [Solirubrobacteraceae bacterium]|nr:hypothetical protein [Solirubrobacteraceae bacterium]
MPRTRILVLANRTIESDALAEHLLARATREQVEVTLLVPGPLSGREDARRRLDAAVERLRADGLTAEGLIGAESPLVAVQEEYDNRAYDEVIVATLERGHSSWLATGLPARVQQATGAVVHHLAVPRAQAAILPEHIEREQASLLEGLLDELHVDTNREAGPLRG